MDGGTIPPHPGIGGVAPESLHGDSEGVTSGNWSSSIPLPLSASDRVQRFWLKLFENYQGILAKKGKVPQVSHYGILSPQVNADFHTKMWYGQHQGVDFAESQGTPLSEIIGGQVASTGFYPWGGEVDVQIPGGMTERYLHLSQINVTPGQKIKSGQRIGLTGGGTPQSGLGYWSKGAHSHVQFDWGNINQGVNPWVVWEAFGIRDLQNYYGLSRSLQPSHGPIGHTAVGGASGLFHLADGGIALRQVTSTLGEKEPEAVVPLSKLSAVLASYQASGKASPTSSTPALVSAGGQGQSGVSVNISGLTLNVHLASARMTDAERDDLMAETITVVGTAIRQQLGKMP